MIKGSRRGIRKGLENSGVPSLTVLRILYQMLKTER